MAWRIHRYVVKGSLDNRDRNMVRGEIWLAGEEKPLVLSLDGNFLRDIAGCLVTFRNRRPEADPFGPGLERSQDGVVGDMTASRRVRLRTPSSDGDGEPRSRLANALYLEWFSDDNGRVVLESADFEVEISSPAWRMTEAEEAFQRAGNKQVLLTWLEQVDQDAAEEADADFFDEDDEDDPMDEFEWELFMREADERTEYFSQLMEKYADDPNRDLIVAREMGWSHLEEALLRGEPEDDAAVPDGEAGDEPLLDDDYPELEPDPSREGVDWIRTERGRITHPLSARAFETAMNMWHYCNERGLIGDDGDDDVADMVFQAHMLSAKLAGALDNLAYDSRPDGGFIVASLKRALSCFQEAIRASSSVREKGRVDAPLLREFRAALFGIREDMLALMQMYRQRLR